MQFGRSDGSKTFNIPDLQGQALDGYPGGDNDQGRKFGSRQGDTFRDIQGDFGRLVYAKASKTFYEAYGKGSDYGFPERKWTTGAFEIDASQGYAKAIKNLFPEALYEQSIENPDELKYPRAFQFKASNVVPTADENRPVNMSVLFCIKT